MKEYMYHDKTESGDREEARHPNHSTVGYQAATGDEASESEADDGVLEFVSKVVQSRLAYHEQVDEQSIAVHTPQFDTGEEPLMEKDEVKQINAQKDTTAIRLDNSSGITKMKGLQQNTGASIAASNALPTHLLLAVGVPEHYSLQRQNPSIAGRVQLPGAYAHGAEQEMSLNDTGRDQHTVALSLENIENGLAVAQPVDEEDQEQWVQARPFPGGQTPHLWEGRHPLLGAVLAVMASLAVVLGLFFGISNSSDQAGLEVPLTEHPVAIPSMFPSSAPTSAMDDLLSILPDYTIASLDDFSSPQFQAYLWLENHRNISNLPTWRKEQVFAMATFYFAFGGPKWPPYASDRWLDDSKSECDWFSSMSGYFDPDGNFVAFDYGEGVIPPNQCTSEGKIYIVRLNQMGLRNQSVHVPPEIALLTSLEALELHWNEVSTNIESMIPSTLPELSKLLSLDLTANHLTGAIPSTVFHLTSLQRLTLALNPLTGALSPEIGHLTDLAALVLWDTSFSSALPTELGLLTNMWMVDLSHNHFTGNLPSEVGLMTNTERFYVTDNPHIHGSVPSEVGTLTKLLNLALDNNSLSGFLPSELASLTELQWLQIQENSLTGQIPTEIGSLQALTRLSAAGNLFSGTIQTEFGRLRNLKELDMSSNPLLSGSIPLELSTLATAYNLSILDLGGNSNLEGEIPDGLCLLSRPNCTFTLAPWMPPTSCSLEFDCHLNGTSNLCGCGCNCSGLF